MNRLARVIEEIVRGAPRKMTPQQPPQQPKPEPQPHGRDIPATVRDPEPEPTGGGWLDWLFADPD